MNNKLIKRVSALILSAVCAAACITGCTNTLSPMETVEEALVISVQAGTQALKDNSPYLSKMSENGGSIEYVLDLSEAVSEAAGMELDIGASVKTYVGSKNGGAINLGILLNDAPLADATLHVNSDKLLITSEQILGDTAYGVGFADFMENFASSEFAAGGTFDLGIDVSAITPIIEWINTNSQTLSEIKGDVCTLARTLKPHLYDIIETRGNASIAKGELTVDEMIIKTNDVTFTYTGEQFIEMIKDILTIARDNEEVKLFIDKYDDLATGFIGLLDEPLEIAEADGLYADYKEALTEVINSITVSGEEILTASVNIVLHISKKNGQLIGFDMDIAASDENMSANMLFAPSVSDPKKVIMSISGIPEIPEEVEAEAGFSIGSDIAYIVDIIENSDKLYHLVYDITTDGESLGGCELTWDKVSGDYNYTIDMFGQTSEFSANIEMTEEYQKTTYNSYIMNGVPNSIIESFTVRYSDELPSVTEYSDILTMTAEELGEAINAIVARAQNLLMALAAPTT